MEFKKACLKIGSALTCLSFLIMLLFLLNGCATYPAAFNESRAYQTEITTTGLGPPRTITATFLGHVNITPLSGQQDTTITITGNDFLPMTPVTAWFDSNGNAIYDVGEPTNMFTINASGNFPDGVELTVPSLPDGNYFIFIRSVAIPHINFSTIFRIISFPLATLLWTIGGVIFVIVVSAFIIRNQIIKKKTEKTREKFESGEITLNVSNVKGKIQVSPDTPLKVDKTVDKGSTRGAGKQSPKVKGSLFRDDKEGK